MLSIWDPGLVTCDDDIRVQLRSLPQGLDEIYTRCLHRIHNTNLQRSREIAPKVFKWVASAKRPLTAAQAREAVSMTLDNLPLQKSAILTAPVTDYCANLVVEDEVTGMLTFPHPTVREFLSNASNLPAELSRYRLCHIEDDRWCGELCLAYVRILHQRKQVVMYRTQTIETDIMTPMLKTVLGVQIPFRRLTTNPNSTGNTVRIPLLLPPTPQGLIGRTFSMHDYLCKYWLLHCQYIRINDNVYSFFTDLCLSHDTELQPWATDSSTGLCHYQRAVEFAVLNSHAILLDIILDHLQQHKADLVAKIFDNHCPGTDSSFLHVAAALGQSDIVDILLRVCRKNFADANGKSAAAIAMMCHHSHLVPNLLPSYCELEDGFWTLTTVDSSPITENLLLESACYDVETVTYILSLCSTGSMWRNVSTAFFRACRQGNHEVCSLLIAVGANPNSFFENLNDDAHLDSHHASSLREALRLEDVTLMSNLLKYGAHPAGNGDHCDIADVIHHFRGNFELAQPYIDLLLPYGTMPHDSSRLEGWLTSLIELSSAWENSSVQHVNLFVRYILQNLRVKIPGSFVEKTRERVYLIKNRNRFAEWLRLVPDDVLVTILNHQLLWNDYLLLSDGFSTLALRGTSRGLESFIWSLPSLQIVEPSNRFQMDLFDILSADLKYVDPDLLESTFHQARRRKLKQTIEFIACTDKLVNSRELSTSQSVREPYQPLESVQSMPVSLQLQSFGASLANAIMEYRSGTMTPPGSALVWVRCLMRAGGNAHRAKEIFESLVKTGSDGNFALNFPAGYTRVPLPYVDSLAQQACKWIINESIQRRIYGWNFRLNRKTGREFSEADFWYLTLVWHMILETTQRQCMEQVDVVSEFFANPRKYFKWLSVCYPIESPRAYIPQQTKY